MTTKINKEKTKKLVLTKIKPDMNEEEIFQNLMKAFKKQGIIVRE